MLSVADDGSARKENVSSNNRHDSDCCSGSFNERPNDCGRRKARTLGVHDEFERGSLTSERQVGREDSTSRRVDSRVLKAGLWKEVENNRKQGYLKAAGKTLEGLKETILVNNLAFDRSEDAQNLIFSTGCTAHAHRRAYTPSSKAAAACCCPVVTGRRLPSALA